MKIIPNTNQNLVVLVVTWDDCSRDEYPWLELPVVAWEVDAHTIDVLPDVKTGELRACNDYRSYPIFYKPWAADPIIREWAWMLYDRVAKRAIKHGRWPSTETFTYARHEAVASLRYEVWAKVQPSPAMNTEGDGSPGQS